MEPPSQALGDVVLSTSKQSGIRPEFTLQQLLIKVGRLPPEVRLPILAEIDLQTLDRLCQEAANVAEPDKTTFENLIGYCNDANFWRDLTLAQGYDLPEGFPEIVDAMRPSKDISQAEVIRGLFFRDVDTMESYFEALANNIEKGLVKGTNQLILDTQYLLDQIRDHRERHGKFWPKAHFIHINKVLSNTPGNFPEKTSYDQLLQYLVDNDYPIGKNPDQDLFWLKPLKISLELAEQINEQEVATIGSFLKEGDLVGIIGTPDNRGTRKYYYFTGNELILMKTYKRSSNYYLPVEAASFLGEHKMFTWEGPFQIYKMMGGLNYVHGFFVDGKFLDFAGEQEGKLTRLNGYDFWIK